MNRVKIWVQAVRPQFFTATIIPIILGTAIAWDRNGLFSGWLFVFTLLGGLFIHGGLNFSNDYYDFKTGNDVVNKTPTPFSGGSRFLREGILKPRAVLTAALICFAAGSAIGLYLNYIIRGNLILLIGIIGVFLAFFYTAEPLKIGYTPLAEISTGLGFGTLMVLGSYYVQTQRLSWDTFCASVPVAILIALVLYINEFPDYEADKAVGKNNMVVRLGKERAIFYYSLFLILMYCFVIGGIAVKVFPLISSITLVTLPLAIRAIGIARAHFNRIDELLPANALTIGIHFLFGTLFALSYILDVIVG